MRGSHVYNSLMKTEIYIEWPAHSGNYWGPYASSEEARRDGFVVEEPDGPCAPTEKAVSTR